ncbi:hypothetical protein J4Q44_G00037030 [Coregonus suidteri]|uniref:Uncharacterized protein n=1 Tax=Coregonus suidteri TaxID=861788 RepID=A0AAN8NC01_9TELE
MSIDSCSIIRDLIIKVIQQNMGGIKLEDYRKPENVVLMLQTIYYEAGFLVLNCGGEMHQRQRKNADCQRGFFTTALIATSIFIMTGALIAQAANQNITSQIKSTRRFISTNMRDLKTFANNTYQRSLQLRIKSCLTWTTSGLCWVEGSRLSWRRK